MKKMLGDDEYLWSFTKGFAELPSPAQVRYISALGVGGGGGSVAAAYEWRCCGCSRAVRALLLHPRHFIHRSHFPIHDDFVPPLPPSNAHGFVPQLKASLAEQLSVKQLREEFRRYITARVAEELMDFYFDSLDREEVKGFFERQVMF